MIETNTITTAVSIQKGSNKTHKPYQKQSTNKNNEQKWINERTLKKSESECIRDLETDHGGFLGKQNSGVSLGGIYESIPQNAIE